MAEKKINIAIIGLGFGAEFIPIYQNHPNANLVAVCQRNKDKLKEIGDAFGITKQFASYDELLEDPEIDAVHINTPIPDHAPQSIKALQKGKHVACTVPMATSIESSSARSSPRKTRAAERATASRLPAMLKLRSSATATESGKSPAVKAVTCWTAPSSRTVKSSRPKPLTGWPWRSVTQA